MIHQIFSVHDVKAQAFLPPFVIHRQEMAERLFRDSVNDRSHQFGKNPADYTLFWLGEFDDSNGQISLSDKHPVANGVEFLAQINDGSSIQQSSLS